MTKIVLGHALRRDILDLPNARSSHSTPTPRGGGVAIVLSASFAFASSAYLYWVPRSVLAALLGGGLLVAGVGYLDDRHHVAARWRMLLHIGAASWAVAMLWPISELPLPWLGVVSGWTAVVLAVAWIVWLINLYNFMDGIDGIAGSEAATVSFASSALLWLNGESGLAFLTAALGAASIGFLVWNWPPARIFMGDSGSGFLGFVFGTLALVTHNLGAISFWVWPILLGTFIVDATWTLFHRLFRGQPIYQAHCSHAYQHAARRMRAHKPVTLTVIALNLLWLTPIAALVSFDILAGVAGLLLAYTPMFWLAHKYDAGRSESEQQTES